MKRFWIIFSILTSSIVAGVSYSQSYHTKSDRALKAYNDGIQAYDFFNFGRAEEYFNEAILIDKEFFEVYMMLGELMTKQRRYSEAAVNYRTAVKIDSMFFKPVFFSLGYAEFLSGDYSNALNHFKVYLGQEGMSEKNRIVATKNINNCEFALKALKHPVLFNPVTMGNAINTSDDEYWPSITVDGQTLMFTRQPSAKNIGSSRELFQEDFYISYFINGSWQKAFNAGSPLNTRQNEGAQTLASNGRYMYFTACDRTGGSGSCDIYFSVFNGGRWSEPYNLQAPVNTSHWESQPSISADGKTLFFSSSRPGGMRCQRE